LCVLDWSNRVVESPDYQCGAWYAFRMDKAMDPATSGCPLRCLLRQQTVLVGHHRERCLCTRKCSNFFSGVEPFDRKAKMRMAGILESPSQTLSGKKR